MMPETLLAMVTGQSVAPTEPVGGRVPQWTLAEAGFGMGYLSSPYLLAFCYRYARDPSVYGRLYEKLLAESRSLARNERWKHRVNGRFYLEYLVAVVLAEEWMSHLNRQRLLMQIEREWGEAYGRHLVKKQGKIAMILDRWCAVAHEHIARRISDVDLECDLA